MTRVKTATDPLATIPAIRHELAQQPRQVIELVVAKQGLLPVALGIAAGLAAAIAAARLLAARLYEISPIDPVVYAAVTGLMVLRRSLPLWSRRGELQQSIR